MFLLFLFCLLFKCGSKKVGALLVDIQASLLVQDFTVHTQAKVLICGNTCCVHDKHDKCIVSSFNVFTDSTIYRKMMISFSDSTLPISLLLSKALLIAKVISESAFNIKSAFDTKSAFRYHFWKQKCKVGAFGQFWSSDEHETTRGSRDDPGRFAFHLSFGRPTSTKRREGCDGDLKNLHFTTVLDVRRARSDERVAATYKIRISPQFWTSDEHETTGGLRGDVQNSQFWTSDEHETTRGWSPVLIDQTHPA